VINDLFDIAHITIAVPDLEQAMAHYAKTLGVEWSTVLDIGPMEIGLYDADGDEISEGLFEVWSLKGGADDGGPSLELSWSAPGTASQRVWGVSGDEHRMHHICYYVDDLVTETRKLLDAGFTHEVSDSPPGEPPVIMSYVVSPFGVRYELMRARDKPAMARWLRTGEMRFDD
jgi:catechol 2,3-dioxygenase-like lactoylglutathione lyase family enzyme